MTDTRVAVAKRISDWEKLRLKDMLGFGWRFVQKCEIGEMAYRVLCGRCNDSSLEFGA